MILNELFKIIIWFNKLVKNFVNMLVHVNQTCTLDSFQSLKIFTFFQSIQWISVQEVWGSGLHGMFLIMEWDVLIRFDPMKIRNFSTVDGAGWIFNAYVVVLYGVSMVWSVWVRGCCYGFDGFNLWCVSDTILWVL